MEECIEMQDNLCTFRRWGETGLETGNGKNEEIIGARSGSPPPPHTHTYKVYGELVFSYIWYVSRIVTFHLSIPKWPPFAPA